MISEINSVEIKDIPVSAVIIAATKKRMTITLQNIDSGTAWLMLLRAMEDLENRVYVDQTCESVIAGLGDKER